MNDIKKVKELVWISEHPNEVMSQRAETLRVLKAVETRGDGHKECPLCCRSGWNNIMDDKLNIEHDHDCPLFALIKKLDDM